MAEPQDARTPTPARGAPAPRRPGRSAFRIAAGALAAGLLALLPAPREARAAAPVPALPALAGVALDDAGVGLAGVEIRVAPWVAAADAPAVIATTRTDTDGRFAFDVLPVGDYRLIAVKGGYAVLVGKVSTLAHETLQLILKPSAAGQPGVAPDGRRWALRLPSRDLLEDVDQSVPALLSQGPERGARREQAVLIEVAGGRVADASGDGLALSAQLGAWLDLGVGPLGFDYRRVSEGSGPSIPGDLDALRLSWLSPVETGIGTLRVELSGAREERSGLAPGTSAFDSDADGARLHASSLRAGEHSLLRLALDADLLSGSETGDAPGEPGAAPFRAHRATFGVEWSDTHGRHDVELGATVQTADTGWTADTNQLATPLARTARGTTLATIGATGGSVQFVDRVRVSNEVILAGRAQAALGQGPWGAAVGGAVAGVRWEFVPGLAVHAEAGASLSAASSAEPVYLIAVEGRGEGYAWSIERAVESGFAPWPGAAANRGTLVAASQGDTSAERWSARGLWTPGVDGFSLELGVDRFRLSGTLATVLPNDLLLVPVVGGATLSGDRALFALSWARLGSAVQLSWDRLADEGGGGALLSGAGAFHQGAVRVRQRVLASDAWGATASVLVAYESARYEGQPVASARTTLTERSRVSGGLAVEF